MERDSLRDLLYSLARFGLYLLINIFGVIIGKTAILGVVGTFIPRLQLYDYPERLSLISWFIPIILIIALFADDAKRHTAYGRYNPFLVSITLLISSAVYYLPALLISYIKDIKIAGLMKEIYFTSFWLSRISDDVEIYSIIGTAVTAIVGILSYLISRRIYLKKFERGEYEYEFDR